MASPAPVRHHCLSSLAPKASASPRGPPSDSRHTSHQECPALTQDAKTPLPQGFLGTVRGQRGTWGTGAEGLPGKAQPRARKSPSAGEAAPADLPCTPKSPASGATNTGAREPSPRLCLGSPSFQPPPGTGSRRDGGAVSGSHMPPKPKPPLGFSTRAPHACPRPQRQRAPSCSPPANQLLQGFLRPSSRLCDLTYFGSPNKPHPFVSRLRQSKSTAYLPTLKPPLPGKLLPALESQAELPPPPGGLPSLDSVPALPTTEQGPWPVTAQSRDASTKADVWPRAALLSGPNSAWHIADTQTPSSRTESNTARPELQGPAPNPGVPSPIRLSFGTSPASQASISHLSDGDENTPPPPGLFWQ